MAKWALRRVATETMSSDKLRTENKKRKEIERMKTMKVKITFTEPVLGTWPANPQIAEDFIAAKSPDAATIEEEIAAIGVDEYVAKGKTIFPKLPDGTPFFYDYQIKGFFKGACGMLSRVGGKGSGATLSSKLKAYKKIIDGLVFVAPRQIPITVNGEISDCQRPLRAQTAQGERVSLANSEEIPAGASFECEIQILDDALEATVLEWLDYGRFSGIGQWRNSGKGRFNYEVLAE